MQAFHYKRECARFLDSNVRGSTVLELGCGDNPHPRATVTLDSRRETNADIVLDLDADRIPLTDTSMDCIIMNNVLEHLSAPQKVIDECGRVLKRGGMLLITVPFMSRVHQPPHDYYRYTNFILEKMLHAFSSVEIVPVGNYKDVYIEMQNNLIGLIKRKSSPICWAAGHIIRLLTPLLPDMAGGPRGYFIKAIK